MSLLTTTVKKSELKKLTILNKYVLVLTSAVLCWFLHIASMLLAETLIKYVDQGEEECHLKFLDLVNTILNDKKVRISRNHFSADKW